MDKKSGAASSGAVFPRTLTLKSGVTVEGRSYSSLTFRMPKGRDWARWGNEPEGPARTHGLLADLAGVPGSVIQELDFPDHAEAVEIAESFFVQYQLGESGLTKQLLTSPGALAGLMKIAVDSGLTNSSGSSGSPSKDGTPPGEASSGG